MIGFTTLVVTSWSTSVGLYHIEDHIHHPQEQSRSTWQFATLVNLATSTRACVVNMMTAKNDVNDQKWRTYQSSPPSPSFAYIDSIHWCIYVYTNINCLFPKNIPTTTNQHHYWPTSTHIFDPTRPVAVMVVPALGFPDANTRAVFASLSSVG